MKKIMFNDKFGLTEKVLLGQKTMTRRFVSPLLYKDWIEVSDEYSSVYGMYHYFKERSPYKVGEIIAIAQSYKDAGFKGDEINRHPKTLESRGLIRDSKGWNNKMFVRSEAMPHHIRITRVRVEPIQEITNDECLKEGIEIHGDPFSEDRANDYSFHCSKEHYSTPYEAFGALIDKMTVKGMWAGNPCVFVYEFELID